MAPLTPAERTLRARQAAHSKWAQHDPVQGTAKAREAFDARFQRQVDPDGVLSVGERQRRAEHARNAYFTRLALASARARKSKSINATNGGPEKSAAVNNTPGAAPPDSCQSR
jgi:hypothetical protein